MGACACPLGEGRIKKTMNSWSNNKRVKVSYKRSQRNNRKQGVTSQSELCA
jgi:hypothetical protein